MSVWTKNESAPSQGPDCPLKIYRDTAAGMIPCEGGDFVRFDEASRYFQWQVLNRVLGLVQNIESKTIERSKLYHALMEMRPETIDPSAIGADNNPDNSV
jgi:hypothetical protein